MAAHPTPSTAEPEWVTGDLDAVFSACRVHSTALTSQCVLSLRFPMSFRLVVNFHSTPLPFSFWRHFLTFLVLSKSQPTPLTLIQGFIILLKAFYDDLVLTEL